MKNKFVSAIVLVASFFATHFNAQAQDLVSVQVAHEFSVGKTTLPAGNYTIQRLAPEAGDVLLIRSADGQSGRLLVPVTFESRDGATSKLIFAKSGESYSLSKIESPVGVFTVAVPRIAPNDMKRAAAPTTSQSTGGN